MPAWSPPVPRPRRVRAPRPAAWSRADEACLAGRRGRRGRPGRAAAVRSRCRCRPAPPPPTRLATRATYTLNPEARRIDVAVAATFENTDAESGRPVQRLRQPEACRPGRCVGCHRAGRGRCARRIDRARERGQRRHREASDAGSATSGRSTSAWRTSSPMGRPPGSAGAAERRRASRPGASAPRARSRSRCRAATR